MNHWCAVNVKHYVAAIPQMSPSHDCLQHHIYLLKLDISEAKSARAPQGEPSIAEYATKALLATSVCIYMQGGFWLFQYLDAIPVPSVRRPPGDVCLCITWDMPS